MKRPKTKPSKLKRVSLFGIACVSIALAYFGYRTFVFLGPQGLLGFASSMRPQTITQSCFEEVTGEDVPPQEQQTFVSSSYQQFIEKQSAEGPNLLANLSLERTDPNSGQPLGYYWISNDGNAAYSYEREKNIVMPYLRVTTSKNIPADSKASGWITNEATIKPNATYAYSFSYRSTSPIAVSLEYTMPDGTKTYEAVTTLAAEREWQRFTHYMTNKHGATAFRFVATSREAGQVDTRDYSIYRITDAALKQGIVSIAFDDGWQSIADNAIPLLERYNFRSTQYIIGEAVQRDISRYMTADTLRNLRQHGHEIGSHSLSHCDQTQLANTEILDNATASKTVLEDAGLNPVTSFAFPYGRYDDNAQPLIARAYPLMRSSDTGYNDRYFDARNIRAMAVSATTSETTFTSWLDYAKKHRLWLVVVYHQVGEKGPYSITPAQFERQLEHIKASGLKVLPVSEAAQAARQ